jgi:hypothetical protein
MTDRSKIEKILKTLTEKFDQIVVAFEKSKDLSTMKIEELQASLETHELRVYIYMYYTKSNIRCT